MTAAQRTWVIVGASINAGLAAWNFTRLPDPDAAFAGSFCVSVAAFLGLMALVNPGGDS